MNLDDSPRQIAVRHQKDRWIDCRDLEFSLFYFKGRNLKTKEEERSMPQKGKIRNGIDFNKLELDIKSIWIDEKIHVRAANGKGLVGGRFHLDYPSVGATETLMMAASMTEGVTVLTNVAWEPEVVDLAQFLNACGACIKGGGTNTLVITGTKKLHGAEFTIMPDRIEAGTFMVAAAITRSCISLSPVIPSHLTSLVEKLSEAGCKITEKGSQTLEVSNSVNFTKPP
ncbi:uncharacterized protein A4U43_C01F4350 [Asparagus officinalis]|uniref:UDP-N-acetylglucosamine 1-carboxyvinyltransferase n=1 Tax=Asparagus officinalis TaxID=4686 RepID=A0A5P1FRD8_ASPOF|nr:uncharacterized protein A4U43_C01F4350 [Asparagus officinalis]